MPKEETLPGVADFSKQTLRQQVARLLEDEPEDADNLMDFGLSSIGVMQLVAQWRKIDIDVEFAELARRPTIDGMWDLLRQKTAAALQ